MPMETTRTKRIYDRYRNTNEDVNDVKDDKKRTRWKDEQASPECPKVQLDTNPTIKYLLHKTEIISDFCNAQNVFLLEFCRFSSLNDSEIKHQSS